MQGAQGPAFTPDLVGVYGLSDNDRIIHHDAEDQQEGKQRNHIQAHACELQQEQGAQKRHRDAGADPERQLGSQKEHQHQGDQQQTANAVFQQRGYPAPERLGNIPPYGETHSWWQ